MFDTRLTNLLHSPLSRLGQALARLGISANAITLIGLFLAFIAAFLIYFGFFYGALFAILLNRICDGLDGAIARADNETPKNSGAFLDICCDFIFYGLIPLSFGLYAPQNLMPSLFLLFVFYIHGTAFLAFATLEKSHSHNKGFHYLVGLTEGFETILFFMLFCLFPQNYAILAYIFAFLCAISAFFRVIYGFKLLR
jgi:phosphatidylglycerophosphate synthase